MGSRSLKRSSHVEKERIRKFRAVFYQRFEQMIEFEAENEEAASEVAHSLLERGEIDPARNWGKSEIDLGGVYEITDGSGR